MDKQKVIQTLYSGLGGHGNVVFSLLETDFGQKYSNVLVFFGVEPTLPDYIEKTNRLNINSYNIRKKPHRYIESLNAFRAIIDKEKPDKIIIHNSELIISAVSYKKKNSDCQLIYVEHEPNHTKNLKDKFLSKYALKQSDTVVCLNEGYKKQLLSRYKAKSSIMVIPNGVNIDTFLQKNNSTGVKTIGMAARLTSTKEHKILLHAFSKVLIRYPNLKLKIAGDGPLKSQLLDYATNLNINESVDFVGLLKESEMIDFYQGLDLYVHATKSETLSTSILQAMAAALPVITSDIVNNTYLIEQGKDGLLYVQGDTDNLVSQITFCITEYDSVKKYGILAQDKVISQYSNQTMSRSYQNILRK